jgi:replicative DNA helicase
MSEGLIGSLQDNVAALAVFSIKGAPIVRASVDVSLFTSRVYRDIITRAYAFLDKFKKPINEHIGDHFEDLIEKGDEHGELLSAVLLELHSLWTDKSRGFNEDYVLADLERFVRQQSLKVGIVQAHAAIQTGDLEAAEAELNKAMRARSASFTPGITLLDTIKLLSAPEQFRDTLTLGIKELDVHHLGPAKQELHLFVAPPKQGKSWWLTHCAKHAVLIKGWKGVYITLELSEKLVGRRMMQSLFALKTSSKMVVRPRFVIDEETKKLVSIDMVERPDIISIEGYKEIRKFTGKVERMDGKLLIKGFPTGSLTVHGIEAYLSLLDSVYKFVPDFVCLDYADLMKLDANNYRLALGELYKDLRGLAVERNFALITASQSNRSGANARLLQATDVAEDYSKIGTADCVLTYSASAQERRRGLARLHVAAGRVAEDKFTVVIGQSYASGQFAVKDESFGMMKEYWTFVGKDEDEEE